MAARKVSALMLAAALGTAWTLLPALLAMPAGAQAQQDKKGAREREAARRAQQALKKAEEEKAALLREKTELDDKLKAATVRIGEAEKAARGLQGAVARARKLEQELAAERATVVDLKAQLEASGQRVAAAGALQTETQRSLGSRDVQVRQLQATLLQSRTQAAAEIGSCEAKNAKLYAYGTELMRLYRDKTAFDAIRQAEPLTGLKSVEIENVLEEYRDKLAAGRAGGR